MDYGMVCGEFPYITHGLQGILVQSGRRCCEAIPAALQRNAPAALERTVARRTIRAAACRYVPLIDRLRFD